MWAAMLISCPDVYFMPSSAPGQSGCRQGTGEWTNESMNGWVSGRHPSPAGGTWGLQPRAPMSDSTLCDQQCGAIGPTQPSSAGLATGDKLNSTRPRAEQQRLPRGLPVEQGSLLGTCSEQPGPGTAPPSSHL